jgi:hypothetical protein
VLFENLLLYRRNVQVEIDDAEVSRQRAINI